MQRAIDVQEMYEAVLRQNGNHFHNLGDQNEYLLLSCTCIQLRGVKSVLVACFRLLC